MTGSLSFVLRSSSPRDRGTLRALARDAEARRDNRETVDDLAFDAEFDAEFDRRLTRSSVSVIECKGVPVGSLWIDEWSPHVLVTALHLRDEWIARGIQFSVLSRVIEQARVLQSDVEVVVAVNDLDTLTACDRLGLVPSRIDHAVVHMMWRSA